MNFIRSKHAKRWAVEVSIYLAVYFAIWATLGFPWQLVVLVAYGGYAIGAAIGYKRGLADHVEIVVTVERDMRERKEAAPWN